MQEVKKPQCGDTIIYHPIHDIQCQANQLNIANPQVPGIVVQAFDTEQMHCNLQVFPDSDLGCRQRVSVPHVSSIRSAEERYWRWPDELPYGVQPPRLPEVPLVGLLEE
ncbi:MAG: hypothetical protein AAFV78_05540 [Bacteroidota bacterium]